MADQCDPYLDMIAANREAIIAMHREAVRRARRCLERDDAATALRVLEAVQRFHPMHGESWAGWPVESD